jgi:hypothetical protein
MQTHITCLQRARHADFPFAYTHELFFTKHLSNNKNNCKALNSYGTTRKEQKKKILKSNKALKMMILLAERQLTRVSHHKE